MAGHIIRRGGRSDAVMPTDPRPTARLTTQAIRGLTRPEPEPEPDLEPDLEFEPKTTVRTDAPPATAAGSSSPRLAHTLRRTVPFAAGSDPGIATPRAEATPVARYAREDVNTIAMPHLARPAHAPGDLSRAAFAVFDSEPTCALGNELARTAGGVPGAAAMVKSSVPDAAAMVKSSVPGAAAKVK